MMNIPRRAAAILLMVTIFTEAIAQEGGVKAVGMAGRNATFGYFGGTEISASYSARSWFQTRGALRYTSFPRYTLDIRPGIFHDFTSGRIHAEILFQGALQSKAYDVCAGLVAGYAGRRFWADLGYYYRGMLPSDGSKGLSEPVNILYEAGFRCLPDQEKWDLNIVVSNSRLCELERFYQPSLIVEGAYYPLDMLGIYASAALKRAGVFNISSNSYQEYISLGIHYRW